MRLDYRWASAALTLIGVVAGARALRRVDARDLDGALSDAEKAIALGRVDSFSYWTRGLVHAERGDSSAAKADLRKAIELAPSAAFADQIRAAMTEYGLN